MCLQINLFDITIVARLLNLVMYLRTWTKDIKLSEFVFYKEMNAKNIFSSVSLIKLLKMHHYSVFIQSKVKLIYQIDS